MATEPRRVRPPKRTLPNSNTRTLEWLIEHGPLQTKQKALMFAAALGAYQNRREPFSSAEEPIRWQIFENNGDDAFIYALAIAETGGFEVLADEDGERYVSLFEEYANGGLEYLEEHVINQPVGVLDALIDLLVQVRRHASDTHPGLEGITPAQLDALGL